MALFCYAYLISCLKDLDVVCFHGGLLEAHISEWATWRTSYG